MPTRAAQPCPHHETTAALARDQLAAAERLTARRHLEHCEPCRALFRQLIGERYPKFPNYTVIQEIGRGGFGVVYQAIHHGKERVEAIKLLFGGTPTRAAYFENEVHLVSRLRHPNIAMLYEAHLSRTPLYYTMEYVAGEQLDDYCRRRDVSLERRIEIVRTVAGAIEHAHRQGVIHRDLKPQNIIIDADGQPRIVDFGIAKRLGLTDDDRAPEPDPNGGDGHGHKPVVGTLGYIAPEQLAGQAVDGRADVYSLGVLLFHAVTGQPARLAPDARRLAEMLRARQVMRADDLAAIIACCVSPAPEQRYASCAAFATDLENYLAGRPIQARTNPTFGYLVTRIAAYVLRHRPRSVEIAVLASIVLLLTLAFWAVEARRTVAGTGERQTVLIAVRPSTLEALRAGRIGADLPGFDSERKKSWRLLYGQLMERLAAAEPRVVVWDYFFPDSQPEYDAGFIRGVRALRPPVVVGATQFDVNGEPLLCPEIRAAVHSCATLYAASLDYRSGEIAAPLAVQRGFNPPLPSLALAGFAAARFGDCDLDIALAPRRLHLRYSRRNVAPGASRWRNETDEIPVFNVLEAEPKHELLSTGDRAFMGRCPLPGLTDWATAALPLEYVLTADPADLRRRVAGRAVLVGEMLPGSDVHKLESGEEVHGCQAQAHMLDALLAHRLVMRVSREGIALRVALWAAAAALLARLAPARPRWHARSLVLVGATLTASAAGLVAYLHQTSHPGFVDAAIGAATLLAVGGPVFVVRWLHLRQLHLTPAPVWAVADVATTTTVVAHTTNGPTDNSQRGPGAGQ